MVRLRVRLATPDNFCRFNLPAAIVAAGLVSTAIACSEKLSPPSPTQSTATELRVRGCAAGDGYQCRAFVAHNDGREEEVSAKTQWQPLATSDERLVATFDTSTGRVTPKFAGTINVSGFYQGPGVPLMTGYQRVEIVVPPVGLNGTVVDVLSRRVLAGARLAVTEGPNAGAAATTDASGHWLLNVVPTPELKLEVFHPDYKPWTFELWLSIGDLLQPRNLSLYPLRVDPSPTPPPAPTPTPTPPPAPPPAPAMITDEFSGTLEDSYSTSASLCPNPRFGGPSVRCRTFTLPPSPHRRLGAELVWVNAGGNTDSEIELGVQVRQGYSVLATSSNNATTGTALIFDSVIEPDKGAEAVVLLLEGAGPTRFRLKVTRTGIY
jgi:hypothetical protein